MRVAKSLWRTSAPIVKFLPFRGWVEGFGSGISNSVMWWGENPAGGQYGKSKK